MSVSYAAWSTDLPAAEDLVHRALTAALQALAWAGTAASIEVGVELAGDARSAELNCEYRGLEGATNVLSFPVEQAGEALAGAPLLLGDIVLAHGVIRAEAGAQGKTLGDHVSHLLVHGLLHLAGYDHQGENEAETMEALERRILAELGIGDPYAAGGGAERS